MRTRMSSRREARSGLMLLLGIVVLMWAIEAINSLDSNRLDRWGGIYPHNVDRLWGILTSPFLHVSFYPHLIDNTIPLVFMGVIIALRGARRLAAVTLIVIVVGGLGTWLISAAGVPIVGASGLVFGYATYLFARGLFNRSLLEIAVGLVVGLVWGGALVTSVVPHAGVSWQDHVCGALGGVLAAWLLSTHRGRAWQEPRSGAGIRPIAGPAASGRGRPTGGSDLHAALDRALER
jgi:membrane associated rhomboid family serine protease